MIFAFNVLQIQSAHEFLALFLYCPFYNWPLLHLSTLQETHHFQIKKDSPVFCDGANWPMNDVITERRIVV